MNKRARRFKVRPCVVCGYPFADMHHIYPKSRPFAQFENRKVALCPNHHRFAHITYALIEGGASPEYVQQIASDYFDEQFNAKLLPELTAAFNGARQMADALGWIASEALDIFVQNFAPQPEDLNR